MKNTKPDESNVFSSTVRWLGHPAASTVARTIALGSSNSDFEAASNQPLELSERIGVGGGDVQILIGVFLTKCCEVHANLYE
ncbi:MAG: hypothetical protein R3C56_05450 [Pirellulaceae bacterium]